METSSFAVSWPRLGPGPTASHVISALGSEPSPSTCSSSSRSRGPQRRLGCLFCGQAAFVVLAWATRAALPIRGRPSGRRWRRAVARAAATDRGFLTLLHPDLAAAAAVVVDSLEESAGGPLKVLLIGEKETQGGVRGAFWGSEDASPQLFKEMPPDSADIVLEVRSQELVLSGGQQGGWEIWHNRFYPLGGHAFSLANDFIINLASIAKVLRPGGKLLFCTISTSKEEILPFAFLDLPHLSWSVEAVRNISTSPGGLVLCITALPQKAEALLRTPLVLFAECLSEMSRRRYFDVLRPHLPTGGSCRVLDYGSGDGSLMAWAFNKEILEADGPRYVTLLESNPELAERAAAKVAAPSPSSAAGEQASSSSSLARVVVHSGESPWPFPDKEFDVVVMAFVLHHVPTESRSELLSEARRVSRGTVLILEDEPEAGDSPTARRVAWHVTEEHFRPFGQDPVEYLPGVWPRQQWEASFAKAGLCVESAELVAGTLRHPVPHRLYKLRA